MTRSVEDEFKHQSMKATIYQKLLAEDEQDLKDYMRSLNEEQLKVYGAALLEIAKETFR